MRGNTSEVEVTVGGLPVQAGRSSMFPTLTAVMSPAPFAWPGWTCGGTFSSCLLGTVRTQVYPVRHATFRTQGPRSPPAVPGAPRAHPLPER